jgi:hypothetical protein
VAVLPPLSDHGEREMGVYALITLEEDLWLRDHTQACKAWSRALAKDLCERLGV